MKEQIEKQAIEEMACDMCTVILNCNEPCKPIPSCHAYQHAKKAYAKGYRKQSKGEWVANRHISVSKRNRTIHYETYKCSVCGTWNGRHKTNFCPKCGAKMKGDAE
jgi:hypothetical protein